jgi:hypothetical protein
MEGLALLNCHTHTSVVLCHGDEHVMIIRQVLICCVLKSHVRNDAEGQSRQAQMQFAQSKTVEKLSA